MPTVATGPLASTRLSPLPEQAINSATITMARPTLAPEISRSKLIPRAGIARVRLRLFLIKVYDQLSLAFPPQAQMSPNMILVATVNGEFS
jgi:hypothetical protein